MHTVPALDVPPVALVGCGVDLLLLVHRAVTQEYIGDVLDVSVLGARRVRATDDVDVIADRQLAHRLDKARCVAGQGLDRFRRRKTLLLQRQQLQREQFGENNKVGAIVGHHIGEIFDIGHELLEALDLAHL